MSQARGDTGDTSKPATGDFEEELPLLAWISDEPIADPALLSQFHVAEAAGRRVRVLLGGTGGDELFGGYGHYALPWKKAAYASLPASWQRRLYALAAGRWMDAEAADALLEYRTSRLRWHQRSMTHLTAADEAALHDAVDGSVGVASNLERLFAASSGYDPANQQMVVDLQSYMPEQLLPMLDRATMAASVEGRVPFVDVPLVEFCMSLRARTKLGWPPRSQASAEALRSPQLSAGADIARGEERHAVPLSDVHGEAPRCDPPSAARQGRVRADRAARGMAAEPSCRASTVCDAAFRSSKPS